MTERLLQFIWQLQYFNKSELCTTEGESLQIIYPGTYNTNQGPDFLDAKIKVGDTIWAGSIELHINSADWQNHKHSTDANYKNVVLHVVWQYDEMPALPFPTLVLQDRVSKFLLHRYDELMNAGSFIACEKNIVQVNEITWLSWKERLLVERLQHKSAVVFNYLKTNNNHWEETFWWMMAKNFGAKVNSDAFEKIARSVPISILGKHKNQIHQLEALLLGQAGLLNKDFMEDYPKMLQREYNFHKAKYGLQPPQVQLFFLRMRPANFPTVRLAQLAMLVHTSLHLLAKIKESHLLKDIKTLLNVTANDYWHYHYVPDEPSVFKKKHLGTQMTDNILINTVVPVLFAYGMYHKDNSYKDKALNWLLEIAAEKNVVTKGFTALGIENKNAFDSQALIQLKHAYCDKKRCLDCAVGNKLLKVQP
jgi:Protein of unknown function (DUF2851)